MDRIDFLRAEETELSDRIGNLELESECVRHKDKGIDRTVSNLQKILDTVRSEISRIEFFSELHSEKSKGLAEKEIAYAFCFEKYREVRGYSESKGYSEFGKYYLRHFERLWQDGLKDGHSIWLQIGRML